MSDNPVKGEVEKFNRNSLKKVKTDEKSILPTKEILEQVKKEEEGKQS